MASYPQRDIINDTLISPNDFSNRNIIAVDPAITIASPIEERMRQLELHMNMKRFTIEDVPGDGSCFLCIPH